MARGWASWTTGGDTAGDVAWHRVSADSPAPGIAFLAGGGWLRESHPFSTAFMISWQIEADTP